MCETIYLSIYLSRVREAAAVTSRRPPAIADVVGLGGGGAELAKPATLQPPNRGRGDLADGNIEQLPLVAHARRALVDLEAELTRILITLRVRPRDALGPLAICKAVPLPKLACNHGRDQRERSSRRVTVTFN